MAISHTTVGITLALCALGAAAQSPSMARGEVRKLDPETGKITLQHGAIAQLEMPAMTMAFFVKDKSLLAPLKVGDPVRFDVLHEQGRYYLTAIQVTK